MMSPLKSPGKAAIELPYRVAQIAACAAVGGMIALTFIDVLGRQFFTAVPGASEIIAMLLGVGFYAGMSLVTRDNSHIVVGIAVERYSPKWAAAEKIATRAISALSMALIAWLVLSNARKLLASQSLTEYLGFRIGYLVYLMGVLAVVATLWAVVAPRGAPDAEHGAPR